MCFEAKQFDDLLRFVYPNEKIIVFYVTFFILQWI